MNIIAIGAGYRIVSDENKDLIALDAEGNEVARAKTVEVPSGETSLEWQEVDEKSSEDPVVLSENEIRKQKIAELKRQLAELEEESV